MARRTAQQLRELYRDRRYLAVTVLSSSVLPRRRLASTNTSAQPASDLGFIRDDGHQEYLKPLVAQNAVWVSGDNYPRDAISYLTYQNGDNPMRRNYTWVDDLGTLRTARLSPPSGKGMVFVLADNHQGQTVFRVLEQRFPNHEIEELRYPREGGGVFAKVLKVPAAAGEAVEEVVVPPDEAQASLAPPGQLREPRGVAVAPDGSFYVTDFGNDRIQQFDAELKFVRQWGSTGSAPGEFKQPCGIAVGADGVVLVADTWNHRVQAFSPSGEFIKQSPGQLYGPRGIAVAADGSVFVADSGNNRIVRFAKDLAAQKMWGQKGTGAGEMLEPTGIAVDGKGDVYVAANGNGRLQRFGFSGEPKSQFPVEGWRLEAFSEPHVVVDQQGRIWVTVPAAKEVREYSAAGKVISTITADAGGTPRFERPMGITLGGSAGGVVIADLANRLVRLPVE
jgi:sugar lactone lactonase YvrE